MTPVSVFSENLFQAIFQYRFIFIRLIFAVKVANVHNFQLFGSSLTVPHILKMRCAAYIIVFVQLGGGCASRDGLVKLLLVVRCDRKRQKQ